MRISILTAILLSSLHAQAFNIKLDFLHDERADQYFSSNPEAKSAVEKAADDLSEVLTNSMRQIRSDIYTGVNGSTTAQFDWGWSYIDPTTGNTVTINQPTIDQDTVVIYAGTQSLSGSTLGRGGAGGASVLISGRGIPQEWIEAVDRAEANSNDFMSRGSGPVLGTISGAANYAGYVGRYNLKYGLSVGNLWFDSDRNNDGRRDSDAELAASWHYDADDSVAAGKTDLYTVALHEMLHVLGAGTSETWESLANGSNWLGSQATAVAGTTDILESDGHHIRSGIMSARLSDGVMQESLLAPTITPGIRKELTELDVAILADLGFEITSPVPEPTGIAMLCLAGVLCISKRSRSGF